MTLSRPATSGGQCDQDALHKTDQGRSGPLASLTALVFSSSVSNVAFSLSAASLSASTCNWIVKYIELPTYQHSATLSKNVKIDPAISDQEKDQKGYS